MKNFNFAWKTAFQKFFFFLCLFFFGFAFFWMERQSKEKIAFNIENQIEQQALSRFLACFQFGEEIPNPLTPEERIKDKLAAEIFRKESDTIYNYGITLFHYLGGNGLFKVIAKTGTFLKWWQTRKLTRRVATSKSFWNCLPFAVRTELANLFQASDWEAKLFEYQAIEYKTLDFWTKIKDQHLANLKKYQIKTIAEIDIPHLLTASPKTPYKNLNPEINAELRTLSQVVDIEQKINTIISNKIAKILWDSLKNSQLEQIQTYQITKIENISLSHLLTATKTTLYSDLTPQIKTELIALTKLIDYQMVIAATIASHQKAQTFWDSFKESQLEQIQTHQITRIENALLLKLLTANKTTPYPLLTPQIKAELIALTNLTNYQTTISALIATHQKAQTLWETLKKTQLEQIQTYWIDKIGDVLLFWLFTVKKDLLYSDLTPEIKAELFALTKLPNYQTTIATTITAHQKAQVFWDSFKKTQLEQIKTYQIQKIANLSLAHLFAADKIIFYPDLTPQIKTELIALTKLINYQTTIATTITAHQKAQTFWDSFKKTQLEQIQTYQIQKIANVFFSWLQLAIKTTSYSDLTTEIKAELIILAKLTNYQTIIPGTITAHQKAKIFWDSFKKTQLAQIQTYQIARIGNVFLSQLHFADKKTSYFDLIPQIKDSLIALTKLTNYQSTIPTAIATHQKAQTFWDRFKKKELEAVQTYQIERIENVSLFQLQLATKTTSYSNLSPQIKAELIALNQLTDYQIKINAAISTAQKTPSVSPAFFIFIASISFFLLLFMIGLGFTFHQMPKSKKSAFFPKE